MTGTGNTRRDRIVTLNAGASSLRCAVFARDRDSPRPLTRLSLTGLPARMVWRRRAPDGAVIDETALDPPAAARAHDVALARLRDRLPEIVDPARIAAVSHRIVQGGDSFDGPVAVKPPVRAGIAALCPLAPREQPQALAGIAALAEAAPGAMQVACFDTAFHRDLLPEERCFALPRALADHGLRRRGAHGLSFEHVADTLRDRAPAAAEGRVVALHLGQTASLCGLRQGRSVATSTGMTGLDGPPMGTRPGTLDPGVVLHLIEQHGLSAEELRTMLYDRAGLLGLSGQSADMRDLLGSGRAHAQQAIGLFVHRIRLGIGAMAAALDGIDALAFSGAIGAGAPEVRMRICEGLGWLGVRIAPGANAEGAFDISARAARLRVFVVPTGEEVVLARAAEHLLHRAGAVPVKRRQRRPA